MDSAVSRILKAKQYAAERDQRVKVHSFEVELHGDNANHVIRYNAGDWACDCEEAVLRGVCAHAGDCALRLPKTKYGNKGRPQRSPFVLYLWRMIC